MQGGASGPRVTATRDVAVRALQRLAMSAAPAPLPGTMRAALRFTEFGTPAEALASGQVALPPVAPDESLVQVCAHGPGAVHTRGLAHPHSKRAAPNFFPQRPIGDPRPPPG